jgi:hypothetical protein
VTSHYWLELSVLAGAPLAAQVLWLVGGSDGSVGRHSQDSFVCMRAPARSVALSVPHSEAHAGVSPPFHCPPAV